MSDPVNKPRQPVDPGSQSRENEVDERDDPERGPQEPAGDAVELDRQRRLAR